MLAGLSELRILRKEHVVGHISRIISFDTTLDGTARYAGFTSSSCGGLWPAAEAFFALRAKKELFMPFEQIKELFMLFWLREAI